MKLRDYVPPAAAAMYSVATPDELTEATQQVHDDLDELIGPLASSYETVLRAAGKRMAGKLRALAEPLIADARFTPPDEDEVSDADKLAADMAESAAVAQRDASRAVAEALNAGGVSFDVDAVFTDELLAAIGERTTFAADQELRAIYRNAIADAAEGGWTIPETATAILDKVEAVASYRAVAMARTDLVGLANGGSVHVATHVVGKEQTVYKTWLATDDDRTRESHIDADGQSVLVNEYFDVGGTKLAYPGDPFGPDEEVINCRCTVIYGSEPASAVVTDPDAPADAPAPDPLAHVTPDPGLLDSVDYDLSRSEVGQEEGYSTGIEGYKRDLEQHLANELAPERVDVRVRTPSDVAVEIANDGRFMSQFETQTSGGSLAPDMRRTVENTLFDYPRELPDAERPIYGYVGNVTDEPGAVRSYGNTVWRLKDSVRDRTTWTSKDSLAQEVAPSPLNRPSWASVDPYATDHFNPISTPLREWDTMYFEAQVHGGVTLADVEEVVIEYSSVLDKPYYEADAELIRKALRAKGFGDVEVIVRPSSSYSPQQVARDTAALDALDAGGEQRVGLGQDGLGVDVGSEVVPVAPSDDTERRQLVTDDAAALVEHAHGGVLEPVPATLNEQHERGVAALSDDLHTSDDTSDVGGSQPSEGLPSHAPNEEGTMSTTATVAPEQLADSEIELTPVGWDAVLCVEGETTEDGRLLERGSITWRDLPLTLMGMLETGSWGHEGAKVAGRIDTLARIMDELAATGELTSEFGVNELAPLIADRTVRGVSVDLAVLDYEYRDRDTGAVLSEDDLWDYWLDGRENEIVFTVLDGTIVGATVCPMPAIANAEIGLAASAGLVPEARALLAAALEGRKQLLGDVPIIRVFTPFDRKREGLFAAGAVVELADPPRSAFELTEFPGNTPFTVADPDETGWRRVFGHLATWDTCHVGIPGVCTTAPRSSTDPAYALFHQHQYPVAEGGFVDVGVMMLGTGHASLGANRMQATQHYDKPDMIGAYVAAVDGEHGIWVSGVARDTLTPAGLRELRTNPPSGDWRQYQGRLELIAACAVAVPGFPVVASATANIVAAGGHIEIDALIASSGEIVPSAEVRAAMVAAGCACEDAPVSDEGIDDLADLGG